jgi:formamidopyrimidine-DNA glycosylase
VPELPDIVVYIEALEKRILGQMLKRALITTPFLLRTAALPISAFEDRRVSRLRRLGKRVCIGFEDDLWMVFHLMIAGRLHWFEVGKTPSKFSALATFSFTSGTLSLTEAGTRKRASLYLLSSDRELQQLDPGGEEIFAMDLAKFTKVLQSANHTLKRALTDPRLFSGIGNAYSDEILFNAQLSPVALTQKLKANEIERLFVATKNTLTQWIEVLRAESADSFPKKVTAFRTAMAVHGRYKEMCRRCGGKVRRIRYASNETNYCPNCQTGGRLLADRALSRLLRTDWPRTPEEIE